jgi:hypothetical protein
MSQEDKVDKNSHLQWIEDSLGKISGGVWCGALALWACVITLWILYFLYE